MILSIANNKGGTGKTTTCLNLAASLARKGNKCLLVDLDSQSSASIALGHKKNGTRPSVYDVLTNSCDVTSTIQNTHIAKMDLIAGSCKLSAFDHYLTGGGMYDYLYNSIRSVDENYDYVILDTPPSCSNLFLNALVSSDYYIVPVVPEYLALEGLASLMRITHSLQANRRGRFKLLGIVLTMVNPMRKITRKITRQIIQVLKDEFSHDVFKTAIVHNIKLSEAPALGGTIYDYAPNSVGARSYDALANEVLYRIRNCLNEKVS